MNKTPNAGASRRELADAEAARLSAEGRVVAQGSRQNRHQRRFNLRVARAVAKARKRVLEAAQRQQSPSAQEPN